MPGIEVTAQVDGDGRLIEFLGAKERRLKDLVFDLQETIGTMTRAVMMLCDIYERLGRRSSDRPSKQDLERFTALEGALPMQSIRLHRMLQEYDDQANWVGLGENLTWYFPKPVVPHVLRAFLDGQETAVWRRSSGDTKWFELADTVFVVAFSIGFRMEASHRMESWTREIMGGADA